MSKPDEPTTTQGFYSLNGVRALAAKLLGIDPDLKLTKEQEELLAKYGPISKPVWKDGAQVGFVEVFKKPCPPHLRKPFDEALGRAHRIPIEANTVDDWLITVAGIKITSGAVYDRFGRITPGAGYESWEVDKILARCRVTLEAAAKAGAAAPGPAPDTFKRYVDDDRALFDDVERLMKEGMSKTAATQKLANDNRVAGEGTPESRARRLANLFTKERLGGS
jgi:hypothetical protein